MINEVKSMFHDKEFLDSFLIEEKAYWYSQLEQAKCGNVESIKRLAALFFTYEHYEATVYWLREARDDAEAQYELANLYLQGLGVEESEEKALELYKKAAEQGHADAANNLADMYFNGEGVEVNEALALHWFSQAANAGVVEAMFTLGIMYEQGLGVAQNEVVAFDYYLKAANGGYQDAQYRVGTIYLEGLLGQQPDIQLAIDFFVRAASEYHIDALFNLGYIYAEPRFAVQDGKKAVHYFKQAALLGDKEAKIQLARLYEQGQIIDCDEKEAQRWRAAANEQD